MAGRLTTGLIAALLALFGMPFVLPAQPEPAGEASHRFVEHRSGTETCLVCHGDYNVQKSVNGDEHHSLWIEPGLFLESVHAELGCTACHTAIDEHGHRLVSAAGTGGRGCLPCHEDTTANGEERVTDRSPALDLLADDRLMISDALKACITCHPGEYLQYKDSIHGVDVLTNLELGPAFCHDCHGSHYILSSSDERAWTNPKNVPLTCLKCHAEATIQQRFDLTRNVGLTFEESFHGARGEMGGAVAICTTCHGTHEIYASTDGRSKVNALRISDTCGECHEGAQLNFAAAFTHKQVNETEQLGLFILQQAYMYMVVFIIGGFLFVIALHLILLWRRSREARHG
jgi:hypothetical protein